ncbi:hypothetical protein Riv7116_4460 [Rivularia sp. PCC 7116]|uniref:hypothetical protein n=1 Tax=Rivularia sp. PCC 7116 TaxID=373994 RepID=UPI00029EC9AB|nr:hypothetical protein [Rivularia sp. PCC 7116]AFY56881.1 hypothetical protein Riv7116_4460 [Rivularia sp. PCC 7116]
MWLDNKDSVEYEIFKQYERALAVVGVNFSHSQVWDALEDCSDGLEDALRAAISYILWLQEQKYEYHASVILVRSLNEKWKPVKWRDEYLDLPNLKSPGQKWWEGAAKIWGYDKRNQLVADIIYESGKEYIVFINGKEMLIETAWRWGWERVLDYATN